MRLRSIAPPPAAPSARDFLAAARALGERLVREAVWYRGQCSWIGLDVAATRGRSHAAHRSLGPALADGTAGIALLLAHLHDAGGDDDFGRTARGAISQALANAGELPTGGLYGGRLGVAYSAARCGILLGDDRLLARARPLARARDERASLAFDLAGGHAGTIAAQLALARLLDDDRLVRAATRSADALASRARRATDGWSWPPPPAPSEHPLCGFSHGAAGAAWALLELYAVTGEARHRTTAERALDYERAWLDADAHRWPDLRGVERRERRGSFRSPHAASWRHGSPGIALSRLRAWQILGETRYREEALVALRMTAATVERALLAPDGDFSLADGIAGGADVLLLGAALHPEGAAIATRAGDIGSGRHGANPDGWPCGMPGTRTPGLLNGDAGIGLFLLRLHDPTVPSPLLLAPQSPR